jgi:hypothetical protein
MKFHSVKKKNEILLFTGKWMELKNIILSEVARFRKPKATCFLSFMWNIDLIQIQAILLKTGHAKGRAHTREGG